MIKYLSDEAMYSYSCDMCSRHVASINANQVARLDKEYAQAVFPDMQVNDREVFVSGTCGQCFDLLLGEEE